MDVQTTVGHKRLLRWKAPVTSDRLRIRITGARLEPTLAEIGLFKQAELVQPPAVSARSVDGFVTLTSKGLKIVYTTDGSVPTLQSPVYAGPIALERGGTIQAACVGNDGRLGMLASVHFSGFAPAGWKAGDAAAAIDSDPKTVWRAKTEAALTVDMGRTLKVGGFSYLPSSDAAGAVDTYRFETSLDGRTWTTAIGEGRFGNIENSPILQKAAFAPIDARFFRFTALKVVKGAAPGVAEISVLPAGPAN
jgi:alpha-L-fucosidase